MIGSDSFWIKSINFALVLGTRRLGFDRFYLVTEKCHFNLLILRVILVLLYEFLHVSIIVQIVLVISVVFTDLEKL